MWPMGLLFCLSRACVFMSTFAISDSDIYLVKDYKEDSCFKGIKFLQLTYTNDLLVYGELAL